MRAGLALVVAACLVGYAAYSKLVYSKLEGRFLRMRILSAARQEGDREELLEAARRLAALAPRRSPPSRQSGWPSLAPRGASDPAVVEWLVDDESLRVGLLADGAPCVQVPGVPEADLEGLLAAAARDETMIVEDVPTRLRWQSAIDANGAVDVAEDAEGQWVFCFRDYVNAEEKFAMAAARGAFSPLRLRGATRLSVHPGEEPEATLKDEFLLLGLVPTTITWTGSLARGDGGRQELRWEDTELRLGWPRLGKTVPRPPAAEKLRREPWELRARVQGPGAPPLLVLCRRGVGTLAFRLLGR